MGVPLPSTSPTRADILYVDDDTNVRRAFQRAMRGAGMSVRTVETPAAGLSALDDDPAGFAVIVADYWMPEMDGAAFLKRACAISPSSSRILISGHLELPAIIEAVNAGQIHQVLPKPWRNDELIDIMRRSLDRAQLERENARLLRELKERNEELAAINRELDLLVVTRTTSILDGLISALDLRDTETQWHSRRVSAYAKRLANELGISGPELIDVEYGSLLHDVGKIGIPDSILRKPAALDDREWAVMRTHPRLGYELLMEIDFLKQAALVPFHHHERYDGTGYPQRLAGDQIAIGARIFSVVDALDVITTNRPYRRARSFEVARQEIQKGSGTQFDPTVVAAYMKISDVEWKAIQARFIGDDERPGELAA